MNSLQRYHKRHPLPAQWTLQGIERHDCEAAVVIPALAESTELPKTLEDLRRNPAIERQRTLILVVVNQRADTSAIHKADNQRLLRQIPDLASGLNLGWVDATTPETELPSGQGVGLARRIGIDLALTRLAAPEQGWVACLDADTRIEPTYLPALYHHFSRHQAAGAVLPFRHQAADGLVAQQAIDHYEAYLHGTALGLAIAGSPYAYVSLGSALACTASGYMAAGGMPRKQAGEDFYLLQQLRKIGGIAPLSGTRVYPSARLSARTPFGTGQRLDQLIADPRTALHYHVESFFVLEGWLQQIKQGVHLSGETLTDQAASLHPQLADFLRANRFAHHWDQIKNTRPQPQWLTAFHTWFDGLKTIRLLNHLAENGFPRQCQAAGLAPLYQRVGQFNDS